MMNDSASAKTADQAKSTAWKTIVARYQKPAVWRAIWQLLNTLLPYAGLWYLMYLSLAVSWWLAVPLAILAGGFMVRLFIISHDCGHGSFFKSRTANDLWGYITGVLTFVPYHHWRWEHALHHATSGDLDRRGTGDIWTLTVQEYLEASRWQKFAYRLARNPVILFVVAPLFIFLIKQRFPKCEASTRERYSVYWTNLAILGVAIALCWAFGLAAYLLLQLIVLAVAGSAGVWLFYVQHQFEGVYWGRGKEWDYTTAAFPELKTLTVKLAHFDATGSRKGGALKYTVNMAHAKSLFRFDCGNAECLCGDFDLSDELARAVAAHLETTTGEKRCTGWRNKTTIDTVRCDNLLRY